MRPRQLFAIPQEPEFDDWLSRFASLEELFSCRDQLYSKLCRQQLDGIVEGNVVILGAVHLGPSSQVRSGAILKGPLIVGPDAVIDHGVKVLGRTFIGRGSHLSSGAVVSDSVLMHNSLIGENCVVRNSILGCGVIARAGCLIGDMPSHSQNAGTYLGDGSQLGLGSIICAGSIVQRGEVILPGTILPEGIQGTASHRSE
jgi:NDP-sugar pyrophosphorylase family protein